MVPDNMPASTESRVEQSGEVESTIVTSAQDPNAVETEQQSESRPFMSEMPTVPAPYPWSDGSSSDGQELPPMPPVPPAVFYGQADGGPQAPRWGWRLALLAVALLLALGIGTGLGAAIANNNSASSGPVTISSTSSSSGSAGTGSATALQSSVESVIQAVEPSVVEITSSGGSGEAIGSGDILTTSGYVVTNDHVVAGFSNFTVTLSNGTNETATLVGQDAQDDLAVLKISASNLKPISLADSSKVPVGAFVVAVGNPLGLAQSATFGIVSALNRSASEAPSGPATELTGLIQTSAQLNPGNSGGALVNLSGQLIGIPTLGATNSETGTSADGIGYAIPSDRVAYVANQLIKNGQVTSTGQGFLGIQAQDVSAQVASAHGLSVQSGVLIGGFTNDTAGQSPAQQAGLQTGDVIIAVKGQSISNSQDLASALLSQSPGSKVSVTVVRGTSQHTYTVTLGERPTSSQG
jgi:S1-C subfamily serine protease